MNGHVFCRLWLVEVMKDIRPVTTVGQRKYAYAFKTCCGFEFHGPDGFYEFMGGKVDCLYSAKAEGWSRWLRSRERREEDGN